jgi:hypothetical protein
MCASSLSPRRGLGEGGHASGGHRITFRKFTLANKNAFKSSSITYVP